MKRLIFLCALVLGLASCEKATFNEVENEELSITKDSKKFTFHLKGDFGVSFSDMTRAVRLEDDNTAGITDIWVFDYVGDVLVQQVHQMPNDESFGTVTMSLSYGSHVVKFVASKGDSPSLTAGSIAWGKVKDTFVLDYPVSVTASSNGNRAPELDRAITGLQVMMTDAVPADAVAVKVKLSKHYKSLLLSSLLAEGCGEYENTFTFTSENVGKKVSLNTYSLCPSSESWQTDVTVTALGENSSVLSTFTIENVELKKNRTTTLKGEVFSRDSGFSIILNDEWDDPSIIEF